MDNTLIYTVYNRLFSFVLLSVTLSVTLWQELNYRGAQRISKRVTKIADI
jgi:hypothetical protein